MWAFHPGFGFFPTSSSQSGHAFGCDGRATCGSHFTISANGQQNGIDGRRITAVKATSRGSEYAFDANNLSTELYDTTQAPNADETKPR